ncbi:MAG TPA: serine/threonine-protein kinase [Xanthomonadales bacterium]|nr:serine/threonine-protein kinase [Xanthomonadales bacterium]
MVPRDAREFGSYQLIAKLATGGMAEIFLARPNGSGHNDVLVLKRILPHLAEDDHFVTMFRDEADLASKLIHKNVCHVHAFGEFAGTWFIAMEYLHGVPLSRMMTRLSKAGKMLDVRVVAGIIVQACEGLHAAHEARDSTGNLLNVVHRDVSPPNIMVCGDGTVKLLDFGIAKARGANSRTRTGTVKGKNAYMSPEQILGKPLDRRSDVFALAVVMYEMLAIKRLFHRDSDFLTFKAITEEPIPDIRERRPDLPPGMRTALIQAMARDPNGRFDTALSFANAIRSSVATLGGPASPNDLARLLFTDFGDEMAARDEILKAADDPGPAMDTLATPPTGVPPQRPRRPPTQPPPIPPQARSGEFAGRNRRPSELVPAVPSMIVKEPGSGLVPVPGGTPPPPPRPPTQSEGSQPFIVPALPAGVLDLSTNMPVDTWMANPDTDLLSGHRMKGIRNIFIVLLVLAAAGAGIFFLVNRDSEGKAVAPPPAQDAGMKTVAVDAKEVEIDAAGTMSQEDIIALSRYGFFSVTATSKTKIFVDDKLVGETPLTRVPLKPGIYKVKAVGPRGKSKEWKVSIFATKDTDEGTISWDKER